MNLLCDRPRSHFAEGTGTIAFGVYVLVIAIEAEQSMAVHTLSGFADELVANGTAEEVFVERYSLVEPAIGEHDLIHI